MLNPKQERFAREYVVDANATQAAIRAGYSKKTAYSLGQRLLKNAEVADFIATLQAELAVKLQKKAEVSVQWVVEKLAEVVRRTMPPEPAKGEDDQIQAQAASRALELIGKHLGMFVDRSVNVNTTLDRLSDEELAAELGAAERELQEMTKKLGARTVAAPGTGTKH